MSELKTLKDLEEDITGYNHLVVVSDELRKEAIKWVKEDIKLTKN